MRRLGLGCVLGALCWAPLLAAVATAHPLGNFSVNHLTQIRIGEREVTLHYILDQAEIPTFQERGLQPAAVLARKRAEVARHLTLTINGRPAALRFAGGASITFPPGQGGLKLTRVELNLTAPVTHRSRIALSDQTFAGRIGWKAIVAQPDTSTDVRSSAPSDDPTHGLRSYPKDLLSSPADQRTATFTVHPGDGALTAPHQPHASNATTRNRSGDGFAGVFANAAAGHGVLALLLLASFAWGAFHALSPGHGKSMVAAYLIGTRGRARHAVALGTIVTITHTVGVFALGLITLLLSQYVLPEQLYPWLTLASGMLVLLVGAGVLRARIRTGHRQHPNTHDHRHAHAHAHDPDHSHDSYSPDHHHHSHDHGSRGHDHHVPEHLTWSGLIVMGASAGLLPCPSALVVLLAALAQHQVALGLLLIVAFSLGLAATLTALGLLVVFAGRVTIRMRVPARLSSALPPLSAAIILAVGCLLTIRALPAVLR